MITIKNRTDDQFAELYSRAVGTTVAAERGSNSPVETYKREADKGEALSELADAVPAEAARLATLADTAVEYVAELTASLFNSLQYVGGQRFQIPWSEPLSELATNGTEPVTARIGALLDDVASSWETIEPAIVEARDADFAADCRSVLKSPDKWGDVSTLLTLALGGDLTV